MARCDALDSSRMDLKLGTSGTSRANQLLYRSGKKTNVVEHSGGVSCVIILYEDNFIPSDYIIWSTKLLVKKYRDKPKYVIIFLQNYDASGRRTPLSIGTLP